MSNQANLLSAEQANQLAATKQAHDRANRLPQVLESTDLKHIAQLIEESAREGCTFLQYYFEATNKQFVRDVIDVLKSNGYQVDELFPWEQALLAGTLEVTISWGNAALAVPEPPPSRLVCETCGPIKDHDSHTSIFCRIFNR